MQEFDGDLLATHSFQQSINKASSEREAAVEAAKAHFSALATFNMAMIERIEALEKENAAYKSALNGLYAVICDVEQCHGAVQDGSAYQYVKQRYQRAHEIYEKVKKAGEI